MSGHRETETRLPMPGVGIRNQVKRAKAAEGAGVRLDLRIVILLILLLAGGLARAELSVKSININSGILAMAWEGNPHGLEYPYLAFQSQSTNFGSVTTNFDCWMGASGASAYAHAYTRGEVQPLWISAETYISTSAFADTNNDSEAFANGSSSFFLRFELSLPHSYTVSNSLSSGIQAGSPPGQILLTDDLNRQYYQRNPPDGPGLAVAQGLLLPGIYRLSANLQLGYRAPPSGDNSANLVLLATLTPHFPRLSITRNGTSVILAWHTNFVGFQLQSNSNALSGTWNNVGRTVVRVGDQHTVTVPGAVTSGYYRLFKP